MQNEDVDNGDFVILYENHEGNRMLITDAAWEWVVFFSHDLYDISIWSHVASEIGFEETRKN